MPEEPASDEPIDLEITDTLDLHAFRPQDTKAVLTVYLDEAHRMGFEVVRIVHGKGVGVQREIVRKVLDRTEFVSSYKTASELLGSWGATIVTLDR
jgi:dsDNA-specific endonuclease/ATPase MutS2